MAVKKTPKTPSIKRTIAKKPKKKKLSYKYFDEYKDLFTGKHTPVSEAFMDRLASQLIEWANNDEKAVNTDKFWFTKGIYPQTAYQWRKRYKPLDMAYEAAKHRIGLRREEGALNKKFDNNTFFKTAPHYLKEFKETLEWQSSLRQKEIAKSQGTIEVTLRQLPTSDKVPVKDSRVKKVENDKDNS